jgi:AcrR family transcriptional regulator
VGFLHKTAILDNSSRARIRGLGQRHRTSRAILFLASDDDKIIQQPRYFERFGYTRVSIRDITSSVDPPEGAFYNHFDSKEALASARTLSVRHNPVLYSLYQAISRRPRFSRGANVALSVLASMGLAFKCI